MGVPVKVISEHLGHCDTRTTENIYAHIFSETLAQTSDAISRALSDDRKLSWYIFAPSDTENTEVKIQTQNERTFGVYLVFKRDKRSNMILNDIQIHSPRYRMKRAFFNDMQRYEWPSDTFEKENLYTAGMPINRVLRHFRKVFGVWLVFKYCTISLHTVLYNFYRRIHIVIWQTSIKIHNCQHKTKKKSPVPINHGNGRLQKGKLLPATISP